LQRESFLSLPDIGEWLIMSAIHKAIKAF